MVRFSGRQLKVCSGRTQETHSRFRRGNQSSDAGLLLLRGAEKKIGVCARLADAMRDRRDPTRVRHGMFELRARVLAIACGYEDGNDLDTPRRDLALKMAVGRCPETGSE